MALTKKGKMKENLQFQTMFAPEAGQNLKSQLVGKINALPPNDPRIVELLFHAEKIPSTIPDWMKILVGLTGLGQAMFLLMGFFF